jgi:hypothetical protein
MKTACRKTRKTDRAPKVLLPIFAELWDGSSLCIPPSAGTFEGFRDWAHSEDYPEHGQVSFINHKIFIAMSQEELETHNKVKTAIGAGPCEPAKPLEPQAGNENQWNLMSGYVKQRVTVFASPSPRGAS